MTDGTIEWRASLGGPAALAVARVRAAMTVQLIRAECGLPPASVRMLVGRKAWATPTLDGEGRCEVD